MTTVSSDAPTSASAATPRGLTTGGSWFHHAGFGAFIHWDHASQQGVEISWPLVGASTIPGRNEPEAKMSVEQYHSSAATFDPVDFDAVELARLLKAGGAQYAVFTTRHHAGYSMFATEHSDFASTNAPCGRDLTAEFVQAVRAEGLRVGLYYSLPDWHHEDYPAFTDADRPYALWAAEEPAENADSPLRRDHFRRPSPEAWLRYLDYLRGQLTELLTHYGTVDLLWFDGAWERSEQEWTAPELRSLIKSLQPDIVINDRLPGQGDYVTPEQGMPTTAPDGPWELCLTIGESWAYRPDDVVHKSPRSLVVTLAEVVARGGNLLLNVAPTGTGALQPAQVETLAAMGGWLDHHAPAVIGASPAPGVDFYGPVTRSGDTVFLHLVMHPVEELVVRGLHVGRIKSVRRLADDLRLTWTSNVEINESFGSDDPTGELRVPVPGPSDALMDVIAVELEPA